jgi:hypothetical protein
MLLELPLHKHGNLMLQFPTPLPPRDNRPAWHLPPAPSSGYIIAVG